MRTVEVGVRNDVVSARRGLAGDEHGVAFEAHLTPQTAPSSIPATGVARASSIGLPIHFESVEERADRRRRAVQRGSGMLALLGQLHDADLGDGTVSTHVLDQLAACIGTDGPAEGGDLGVVLQEIETRVQVELARRGR